MLASALPLDTPTQKIGRYLVLEGGPTRFVAYDPELGRKVDLRVKVPLDKAADLEVESVTSLWAGADWLEREVFDMFGVRFTGHPDLRRLLLYESFEGHPLRKDYPVSRRQPLIGPAI